MRTTVTTLVMAVVMAAAAHADPGPRRASEIVDVEQGLGSDNCTNVGRKFDTLLAPDGTESPFAIPEKRVLVITGIQILGFGAGAGQNVQTRIFRGVGATVNSVAIQESRADAEGRILHRYEFTPGVVVASGGEVCTNNNLGITTTGQLRGYLAKDR